MRQRYLWLAVTADEYELPLAVCDTSKELGALYGIQGTTVRCLVDRGKNGSLSGRKFVKVKL